MITDLEQFQLSEMVTTFLRDIVIEAQLTIPQAQVLCDKFADFLEAYTNLQMQAVKGIDNAG